MEDEEGTSQGVSALTGANDNIFYNTASSACHTQEVVECEAATHEVVHLHTVYIHALVLVVESAESTLLPTISPFLPTATRRMVPTSTSRQLL